jgi:integrase
VSRRGKRVRLERGIFEDATGYSVTLKRGGKQHERRFGKATTRAELRTERATLADQVESEIPLEGTLAGDVPEFLKTIASVKRRRDAALLLKMWTAVFGDQPRDAITALAIDQQLATWQIEGKPAATRRHLRQVLGQLYRKLNGKSGANPVADTTAIRVVYDDPRGMPLHLIDLILDQMPDRKDAKKGKLGPWNKTKARLVVMKNTGLPQSMLMRLQPRDVNLRAGEMYVRPRRKGGGAPPRTLGLTPAAVDAFRDFARAKAWGTFSTSTMARAWRKAIPKAKAAWAKKTRAPWPAPDDARSYDLRHSFATVAMVESGDQGAVSEMLLHATLEQSRRYTQSAVSARNKLAVASMGRAFGGKKPAPTKRKTA